MDNMLMIHNVAGGCFYQPEDGDLKLAKLGKQDVVLEYQEGIISDDDTWVMLCYLSDFKDRYPKRVAELNQYMANLND